MLSKTKGAFLLSVIFSTAILITGCRKSNPTLKIYFAGDLLLDRGVREQINKKGVVALFAQVKPVFEKADFVVANLECPVTKINAPVNKRYIFRGEPEWLKDMREAHITHLVMANNHTYDQGRDGIKDTYNNLIKNGLISVGYGTDQGNACKPVIIEKDGITVALFSSVLLTLENWAYLPDSAGVCQASTEDLKNNIRAYKAVHKGHKIVVMLHWGAEYQKTPLPGQRQAAEDMIDAGADAIIGCHPHVIQSQAIYKGKPIFYSIGNFVFDPQYLAATKGLIVELIFSNKADTFTIQPIDIKNCTPYPLNR